MKKLLFLVPLVVSAASFAKIIETEKGKYLVTKTKVVDNSLIEDLDASGKPQTFFTYERSGIKKLAADEFTRIEATNLLQNKKLNVLVEDAHVHGYFTKLTLSIADAEFPSVKLGDVYFEYYAYDEGKDKEFAEKKIAEFEKAAKKLVGSEIKASVDMKETFRYLEVTKPYYETFDDFTPIDVGATLFVHWELKISFPELPGFKFRNTAIPTFGQWQKVLKSKVWTETK